MEKIKVLHIVNSVNLGGGARAVRTLYNYSPKNIEIHVVSVFDKGEKYEEFSKICKNLFFVNGDLKLLTRYVKDHNIQILHFHSRGVYSDFEKLLIKNLKDKCAIVCTNIFGEYEKESDSLTDYYIFKSFHAFTQKFAKFANLDLKSSLNLSKRYNVIANPIDFNLFEKNRPTNKQIQDFKLKLGIKSKNFVIGKIGSRKAVEKWDDLLLFMFPKVLKKFPNIVMVLQGVPDSRLQWIKKFGDRIIVVENSNDDKVLALLYNSIDVFIHTSKIGEQSGNSINESMYYGKPVITNLTPNRDNGQIEQIENGISGYFANSSYDFFKYISKLISDSNFRKNMGIEAHRFVSRNNNPRDFALKTAQIYFNLCKSEVNDTKFERHVVQYINNYPIMLDKYLNKEDPITFFGLYWKIRDYVDHKFSKNR